MLGVWQISSQPGRGVKTATADDGIPGAMGEVVPSGTQLVMHAALILHASERILTNIRLKAPEDRKKTCE